MRFRVTFSSLGDVQCFGGDCYALAFGVPGLLMVIALGKCSGTEETNNPLCLSHVKHHVSTLHKIIYSVLILTHLGKCYCRGFP